MIEIQDLRVDYGDFTAVRNLSLTIEEGEIYGFIGPNGAGKTTTFKVIGTMLEPTFGEVKVAGFNVAEHPREVHSILGYMPDFPPVYDDLKVREFCEMFHGAYGYPEEERTKRVDEVLEKTSLTEKKEAMCGGLSRGLKQRLLLSKTLLQKPKVLILDEPASGLDPHSRIELREILKSLAAEGCTVLISSHILTEMEGFCTSIGIIEKGELKATGKIDEVTRSVQAGIIITIDLLAPDPRVSEILSKFPEISNLHDAETTHIHFSFNGEEAQVVQILATMVKEQVPVKGFQEKRMDVEDVFMKISQGEVS